MLTVINPSLGFPSCTCSSGAWWGHSGMNPDVCVWQWHRKPSGLSPIKIKQLLFTDSVCLRDSWHQTDAQIQVTDWSAPRQLTYLWTNETSAGCVQLVCCGCFWPAALVTHEHKHAFICSNSHTETDSVTSDSASVSSHRRSESLH